MFVLGIGKNVDNSELNKIASRPNNVFTIDSFEDLDDKANEIKRGICILGILIIKPFSVLKNDIFVIYLKYYVNVKNILFVSTLIMILFLVLKKILLFYLAPTSLTPTPTPTPTPTDVCKTVGCNAPYNEGCRVVNNAAECICPVCSDPPTPATLVCTSDAVEEPECLMRRQSCLIGDPVTVAKRGSCGM